jgi:serine/threonine protein kinase
MPSRATRHVQAVRKKKRGKAPGKNKKPPTGPIPKVVANSNGTESDDTKPRRDFEAGRAATDLYREEDDEDEEVLGSDDEEQEDPTDYCRGGYHPVKIGDLFHGRYHVVRKLGWGHFSTVWLAWDLNETRFVALKIVKSAAHYTETAVDEIKLLKCVRHSDEEDPFRECVVQLLDDFRVQGTNGDHVCMVFEVLGHNLLKFILRSNYNGLPLPVVKHIAKQTLQGLQYLHEKCHIIHTDIKPENVLICVSEDHVRKIAAEATEWVKHGVKPSNSAVTTAKNDRKSANEINNKMSKSQKKRARKKSKRILELFEKQEQQLKELGEASSSSAERPKSLVLSSAAEDNSGDEDTTVDGGDQTASEISDVTLTNGHIPTTEAAGDSGVASEECGSESTVKCTKTNIAYDLSMNVKLADLGNACWTYHHFTSDIQTRQYRSVEVLLGCEYDTSADIWSTACMIFELLTGDYLFDPASGQEFNRDEDHLAHIMELLGPVPRPLLESGVYAARYFTRHGTLINIPELNMWELFDILVQKYCMAESEATLLSSFILPMLDLNPATRASARKCLEHPWLQDD